MVGSLSVKIQSLAENFSAGVDYDVQEKKWGREKK